MFLATNFFSFLLDPIVHAMAQVLTWIHMVVPSYGWSLILLALFVRLALFPLTNQQFKSMAEMQKVQPLLKALQAKYKGDPQKLNAETMALYKEHGVNPLASCFPLLLQMPILISLYYAISSQIDKFKTEHFAWIGSSLHAQFPQIIGGNLADSDVLLLGFYVVSMYFSVRFGSPPSSDPQVAQTNKIMAFMSPAMLAFFGFKAHWPAALIIYWFSFNVFSLTQQLIMYRRYGLVGGSSAAALTNVTPPHGGKGDKLDSAQKASLNGANGKSLTNGKTGSANQNGPRSRSKRSLKR